MVISRHRFQKLAGILNEQMFPREESSPEDDTLKGYLLEYVSYLRAIHLWFQGAHHMTKGAGFAGDHVELFGKVYTEVQEEVDGAVEKAIGVTNDECLACPVSITENALAILEEHRCQNENPKGRDLAEVGLALEKTYIEFLEHMFKILESQDALTLGLNDQLAASANKHEEYVYLLQQRIK
jgi:DNA-binding ferritin-like protein